jgi:hypothetical protein
MGGGFARVFTVLLAWDQALLFGLYGITNILLQAGNNLEEIIQPDKLTYASGQYKTWKPGKM